MGKDRRLDGEIISVSNARCATITTATGESVNAGLLLHIYNGDEEVQLAFDADGLPGFLEYLVGYARKKFPGVMDDTPPM